MKYDKYVKNKNRNATNTLMKCDKYVKTILGVKKWNFVKKIVKYYQK